MQTTTLNHPAATDSETDGPYPGVRTVRVSVDSRGQPHAVPEQVDVSGAGVLIQFLLITDGWNFPTTGAVTVTDPGAQFPYPSWTQGPQRASLLDANTDPGTFQYTIAVVNPSTGQRLLLDPTIKNDF